MLWRLTPVEGDLPKAGEIGGGERAEHLGERDATGTMICRGDLQPSAPGREDAHGHERVALTADDEATGQSGATVGVREGPWRGRGWVGEERIGHAEEGPGDRSTRGLIDDLEVEIDLFLVVERLRRQADRQGHTRKAQRDQASHHPEPAPGQCRGAPRRKPLSDPREEQGRTGNEDVKDQGIEDNPRDRLTRLPEGSLPGFCGEFRGNIEDLLDAMGCVRHEETDKAAEHEEVKAEVRDPRRVRLRVRGASMPY